MCSWGFSFIIQHRKELANGDNFICKYKMRKIKYLKLKHHQHKKHLKQNNLIKPMPKVDPKVFAQLLATVATSRPEVSPHKFRTQQQIKINEEMRNKTVNLKIVIRMKRVGATTRQALHKSPRLTLGTADCQPIHCN